MRLSRDPVDMIIPVTRSLTIGCKMDCKSGILFTVQWDKVNFCGCYPVIEVLVLGNSPLAIIMGEHDPGPVQTWNT